MQSARQCGRRWRALSKHWPLIGVCVASSIRGEGGNFAAGADIEEFEHDPLRRHQRPPLPPRNCRQCHRCDRTVPGTGDRRDRRRLRRWRAGSRDCLRPAAWPPTMRASVRRSGGSGSRLHCPSWCPCCAWLGPGVAAELLIEGRLLDAHRSGDARPDYAFSAVADVRARTARCGAARIVRGLTAGCAREQGMASVA